MIFEERDRLIGAVDAVHGEVGAAQRRLLALVAEVDRTGAWKGSGARDTAHWLAMRYGISVWKAHRWVHAAHGLQGLPHLSQALASGALGLDTTVELARFATPQTEEDLICWAAEVSVGAVRHRGDVQAHRDHEQTAQAEQDRSVSWWLYDQGRRLGLQAWLPAAQGQVVVGAIERMAAQVPAMPGEEDHYFVDARRADALVGLCSAHLGADPDPDRACVVVHARLKDLQAAARGAERAGSAELEGGGVISPQTALRLLCDGRVETIVEGDDGTALGVGRLRREPPAWIVRQVRFRDRGCRFPGCGTRAFTQAHHLRFWRHGGRTDLSNLLLICSFHHRLVHEHGWSVRREADGAVVWTTPEAARYRAGPSPGGAGEPGGEPEPDGGVEAGAQTGAELEAEPREPEAVDHTISTGEVVPGRELVSTAPG